MVNTAMKKTMETWSAVKHLVSVPHTKRDYDRLVALLDTLTDEVGENERHPLASLMETIGVLIESYEAAHVPELPATSATGVLAMLMQDHHLTQRDLPEVGSQGIVSEILHGKRKLNMRQIRALSQRFHVSPLIFIDS